MFTNTKSCVSDVTLMEFCVCPLSGVHLAWLVLDPTKYKLEIISMNPLPAIKTPQTTGR